MGGVPVDPRSAPYPLPWDLSTIDHPPGSVAVGVDASGAPVPVDWPGDHRGPVEDPRTRLRIPDAATQVVLPRFAALLRDTWVVATPVEDPRRGRPRWPLRGHVPSGGRVEAYDLWPLEDASSSTAPMPGELREELGFGPLPPWADSVRASVRRSWGNPVALRVPTGQVDGVRVRLLTGERWQADDPVMAMTPGDGWASLGLRWAEISRLLGHASGAPATWDPWAGRARRSWPHRGDTPGLRTSLREPFAGARPRESVLLTLDEDGRIQPRTREWEKAFAGMPVTTRGGASAPRPDLAPPASAPAVPGAGAVAVPAAAGTGGAAAPTPVTVPDPAEPGRRVVAAARPVLVVLREGTPLLAESGDPMPPVPDTRLGTAYRTYPLQDGPTHADPVPEDLVRRLHLGEWGRDGETYGLLRRDRVEGVYVRFCGTGPWSTSTTTVELGIGEDLADLMGRPEVVREALDRIARGRTPQAWNP